MAMLTDVFIELHVPDFNRTIEFYSRLGFKLRWRSEDYLVMKRKRSVLNFYGGSEKVYRHSYFGRFSKNTKCGYGVEIIIPVDRVERLYKTVRKFAKVVQPLQSKKWGRRDFRILDPFGFYLRITERYEWVGELDAKQKKLVQDYKMKLREPGSGD
ncbi:MAG TPA: VOC family protein [Candidatus Bathyarchaeia archaeon]|nr:VOC family protein [Candidatus Bathyarchaeia archaeon]